MFNRVEESWSLALISIMITDDTCSIECDARVCFFLISNEAVGIDIVCVNLPHSLFGKRSVRLAVME